MRDPVSLGLTQRFAAERKPLQSKAESRAAGKCPGACSVSGASSVLVDWKWLESSGVALGNPSPCQGARQKIPAF